MVPEFRIPAESGWFDGWVSGGIMHRVTHRSRDKITQKFREYGKINGRWDSKMQLQNLASSPSVTAAVRYTFDR